MWSFDSISEDHILLALSFQHPLDLDKSDRNGSKDLDRKQEMQLSTMLMLQHLVHLD